MQQFVFIIVKSILQNLLSCLPFCLQAGFSSFLKLGEFPCIIFPWFGYYLNSRRSRIVKGTLLNFEMATMPFLISGVLFSLNKLYRRIVIHASKLPNLLFSFYQKTNFHLYERARLSKSLFTFLPTI